MKIYKAAIIGLGPSGLAVNKILVMSSREQDSLIYHAQVRSMKLQYNSRRFPITGSLNARYVDGFNWSNRTL